MNSHFLAKNLAKLFLAFNILILTGLLFFIASDECFEFIRSIQAVTPLLYNVTGNEIRVVIAVCIILLMIETFTTYETKVIAFTQADIQKEILKTLLSIKNGKDSNSISTIKDNVKFDLDKFKD
ncbi:hypothetical protein SAMN05216522_10382 [Rosenbergiella nectarea]|uniref:Uncharacterized protein n=1 Tax=Rosenbergiella nectarea TaxID=988801 RepID=A0A1H9G6D2_9GAMM|nr:hypothetical protein [Rosenbergiella nectarea]SEQ45348.1 hypothetical protein SAMN05216522_10382 [Rosenbergiella nectarea]